MTTEKLRLREKNINERVSALEKENVKAAQTYLHIENKMGKERNAKKDFCKEADKLREHILEKIKKLNSDISIEKKMSLTIGEYLAISNDDFSKIAERGSLPKGVVIHTGARKFITTHDGMFHIEFPVRAC